MRDSVCGACWGDVDSEAMGSGLWRYGRSVEEIGVDMLCCNAAERVRVSGVVAMDLSRLAALMSPI